MTETYFTIHVRHDGTDYTGRVSPEKKNEKGNYTSWHVVLNDVFFGYLSRQDGHWLCSEDRPEELIALTGKAIADAEKHPETFQS